MRPGTGLSEDELSEDVLCLLQMLDALAQLREDQQVRVLLFRSAVKGVFCAGRLPSIPSSLVVGVHRGSSKGHLPILQLRTHSKTQAGKVPAQV